MYNLLRLPEFAMIVIIDFLQRKLGGRLATVLIAAIFAALGGFGPPAVQVLIGALLVGLLAAAVHSRHDWTFGGKLQDAIPRILLFGLAFGAGCGIQYALPFLA